MFCCQDNIKKGDDMVLFIMSYVGCVLSATCCFLAIFIYSILQ